MKKIFVSVLLTASLACACQKFSEPTSAPEGKDCVVTFRFTGEITSSEEPLTRSASGNDLYAVQVYKKTAGSSSWNRFAAGFFDDPQEMKLNLKTGSTYNVRICLVRDAKLLTDNYSMTNNSIRGALSDHGPFTFTCGSGHYICLNRFNYNDNSRYNYYSGASATGYSSYAYTTFELPRISSGILNGTYYPACQDWFYAEIENYAPTGAWEDVDVELKRTGFGLRYMLEGVTDGEVTVTISNSYNGSLINGASSTYSYSGSRTFFENTTNTASYESASQFIAFADAYSAWKYADNYAENVSVNVTWKRGIGITQSLGTKTVQVKRNCMNNIRITLGSDDRNGAVQLTAEAEDSMGDASNTIQVE